MPATAPKSGRFLRVYPDPVKVAGLTILCVDISAAGHTTEYVVRASAPTDDGVQVLWRKLTDPDNPYKVVATCKGVAFSCTCPSRTKCRHRAATEALIARSVIVADDF